MVKCTRICAFLCSAARRWRPLSTALSLAQSEMRGCHRDHRLESVLRRLRAPGRRRLRGHRIAVSKPLTHTRRPGNVAREET